ncbi:MAG TPA: dTDP-4-amino-4,6-dideoxygalactose transaminase [Thermoleophilaceae bacterium]|nr:dTDP-4-amino-4,6-dideoxygalactose transaminase [Thermoleophilaceae bacterium]
MTSEPYRIPFNRPFATGREHRYIDEAIAAAHLSSDGQFSRRCSQWLEERTGAAAALPVHSATAALELAMILADLQPGDEVIMPSYTYVSTGNAVVLRGATPVFVDIRPDTLNLDESLVEEAVGPATRAIVPVHYAGVGANVGELAEIAGRRRLWMIEDAAQGVMARLDGRALGTFGALGALSFHETKNVTCGEGGALLVNDAALVRTAEVARNKGTNRADLLRGLTDHYTWIGQGSSYGMSELNAAFLWAQLESADHLTRRRMRVWESYDEAFLEMEELGLLRRPVIPEGVAHNAHMYYVLVEDRTTRDSLIGALAGKGVQAVFHYVPLHDSPGGLRHGRSHGALSVTSNVAGRLVRLPLWIGMDDTHVATVADAVRSALSRPRSAGRSTAAR